MRQMLNQLFKLTCIMLLILIPSTTVFAEGDEPANRGKLKFRTERIYQNDNQSEIRETEMEKIFPDLFKESTKIKLDEQIEARQDSEEKLINFIFDGEDLKQAPLLTQFDLFADDYEAVSRQRNKEMEDEQSSISIKTLFISMAAILLSTALGFLLLFRK